MSVKRKASRGRILGVLASAIVLLTSAGCGQQGDGGFNDTLVALQAQLTAAEKKAEDAIDFPPRDKVKEKAAADEFGTAVADARKRFDAVAVPQGEQAKKFHDGFNNYLKAQEEAAPLYKSYLVPERQLNHQEMQPLRDALDKMRAKRTPLANFLPALQMAYVQESGIRLKPKTYP